MTLMMSSRRTIMSGEVVTVSTAFEEWDSAFGPAWRATGLFEVSASRDAVVVHRAECRTDEESDALIAAIRCANAAREKLAPTWRGGAESMFPAEPTECADPAAEIGRAS